jgi:hypothetical protein
MIRFLVGLAQRILDNLADWGMVSEERAGGRELLINTWRSGNRSVGKKVTPRRP